MGSSEPPRDLDVLMRGIRAAGSFGVRARVAVAILLSLLFAGTLLPVTAFGAPNPLYVTVLIVLLATPLAVVWTVTAGAVTRGAACALAGRPEPPTRSFGASFRRVGALVGTPVLAVCASGFLFGVLTILVQVARVPAVGLILALLLSPVILAVAFGTASISVRWLLSGHLGGTAVSVEGVTPFAGLARGFAYLRAAPLAVVGLRGLALLAVFGRLAWEVIVLGLVVLALVLSGVDLPGIVAAGVDATRSGELGPANVLITAALVLLACWLLSAPVAMGFGGRAGLYLIHRRALDGIPIDAPPEDAEPEKTLEELGVELVERLKDRGGEKT